MCLACEEAEMFFRYQLLEQIAHGTMPEGYTADDLKAMGLPLPGEITIVEQPDGTRTIKKTVSAFACDSPDGE
jgi:hypothetical protein